MFPSPSTSFQARSRPSSGPPASAPTSRGSTFRCSTRPAGSATTVAWLTRPACISWAAPSSAAASRASSTAPRTTRPTSPSTSRTTSRPGDQLRSRGSPGPHPSNLQREGQPEMSEEVNGVPCDKMFASIARFRENGELAAFRFSAKNEWVEGTASRSTIYEWYGIGADQVHVQEFSFTADHPTLGHGHGPTPQEYVLHALAACITAGVATGAAARNIKLNKVSSTVSADIDVRGVLGVDPDIRKGFSNVTVEF